MLENEIKEALEKLKNKDGNINEDVKQEQKPFFTKSRILLIISAFIVISMPIIYKYLSYYFL